MTDTISATIRDVDLVFKTSAELFSPRAVDAGTLAMLSVVTFGEDDEVLDLGCGYGVVGILAAKLIGPDRVVMVDNDERAVALARQNAALNGVDGVKIHHSDGFRGIAETGFALILCNPPYHADFAVPKHFIHKGFNRLRIGGRLYMVTKRRGWYEKKLAAIFGRVKTQTVDDYHVFIAVKKGPTYAKAMKKQK